MTRVLNRSNIFCIVTIPWHLSHLQTACDVIRRIHTQVNTVIRNNIHLEEFTNDRVTVSPGVDTIRIRLQRCLISTAQDIR